jgi:hypothetical protein
MTFLKCDGSVYDNEYKTFLSVQISSNKIQNAMQKLIGQALNCIAGQHI